MHFPSWSFDKPFSKKFELDIWMSTLIQQYKNRHAYDTEFPWWVRSNKIISSFLNLSIFEYIPYSTCCLLLFFLLNMCSLGTSLFNRFLANFQCVASSCLSKVLLIRLIKKVAKGKKAVESQLNKWRQQKRTYQFFLLKNCYTNLVW